MFDWLDVIARLQAEGLTQEKIGEIIGWSVDKVQKTVTLCSRIPPQILVLAKTFQKGRGGCFPPNGGINDHSANTFDFTEGWFRNSGLYELAEENQMVLRTNDAHGERIDDVDTIRTLRERFAARIELDRCNNTQRQPSGNSGGLDMTQSTGSPLAADSKS